MSKRRSSALWEYLEKRGVLEKGTDEEIKAARREYRKQYLLDFKRKQRKVKPEFTVNFSEDNGEYETVAKAANRHKMSPTAFIHAAVFAYLRQSFIVPNRDQIAKLHLLLADCLNEVKVIANKKISFWEQDRKLEAIERRIEKLEKQIDEVFINPPLEAKK